MHGLMAHALGDGRVFIVGKLNYSPILIFWILVPALLAFLDGTMDVMASLAPGMVMCAPVFCYPVDKVSAAGAQEHILRNRFCADVFLSVLRTLSRRGGSPWTAGGARYWGLKFYDRRDSQGPDFRSR